MPRNQLSKFDKELREIISQNLKKYTDHLTQSQLSEMTGIPKSTLSGYFSMRSTPNAGAIQKIADVLHLQKSDIDPRFSLLFSKTGKLSAKACPQEITPVTLTHKEHQLIQKYRALSPEGKLVIETSLDALYQAIKP